MTSPSYPRRRSRARWRLPLVVLMLTAPTLGAQEPEAAPEEPKPTPSPAPYIAQSEVVAKAEIMSDQIAKISARLEANRVETIAEALAPLVASLEDKAPEVEQRRIDGLRQLARQRMRGFVRVVAGARYADMRDLGSIEILLGSNEL